MVGNSIGGRLWLTQRYSDRHRMRMSPLFQKEGNRQGNTPDPIPNDDPGGALLSVPQLGRGEADGRLVVSGVHAGERSSSVANLQR